MSLTNCTHEGNGLVDKTFGIANTLAVFVNEILKGIGFSNPALFVPHCRYINLQWGNYGDSSNTLITLNLNITSSKIFFAIATDITNNGNPQGAYLGYDVIENNKIRFLFDATPWTFAWFCISK